MNRIETKIRIELIGVDKVIEDLDIALKIKKTNEAPPNYCTCTIYNLSDDTYNLIKDNATGARVYVSEGGANLSKDYNLNYNLVFEGDLRDLKKFKKPSRAKKPKKPRKKKASTAPQKYNEPAITSEFEGADVQTVIELQDGLKATLLDPYFSKSYADKFTNSQVIRDVLDNFRKNKVPIGKVDMLSEVTFKNGKVLHGYTLSILRMMCSSAMGSAYIKNGVVCVTNANSLPQVYAILLNGNNCARPEEDKNKEVKVEAPLLPTLNPNDWVMLDFKNVSGAYKVYKIEIEMDNFGQAAGSELTLKAT